MKVSKIGNSYLNNKPIFTGAHFVTLDNRYRFCLPAMWKKTLGPKIQLYLLVKPIPLKIICPEEVLKKIPPKVELLIYSKQDLKKEINTQPSKEIREKLWERSYPLTIDSQGRIQIPSQIREEYRVLLLKELVILGHETHMQLLPKTEWLIANEAKPL